MTDTKGLARELIKFGNWAESAAHYGYRADFCCEYCGLNLLSSVDNFKQWENDHIAPKWASGTDEDWNIAVACRTCNFHLKGKWDPREVCGENAPREELIRAVQNYVREQRTKFLKELVQVRETIDNWSAKQ